MSSTGQRSATGATDEAGGEKKAADLHRPDAPLACDISGRIAPASKPPPPLSPAYTMASSDSPPSSPATK